MDAHSYRPLRAADTTVALLFHLLLLPGPVAPRRLLVQEMRTLGHPRFLRGVVGGPPG